MTVVGINDNSFANITPADLTRLAKLEHYLIIAASTNDSSVSRLAGRALLCAVVFGGLLYPLAWQNWIKVVITHKYLKSHQSFFYKIDQTSPITYRYWYPDAVTGCVLAMLRRQLNVPLGTTDGQLIAHNLLQDALKALASSVPGETDLQAAADGGPEWLILACTARLQMRVPALLANHAAGRVHTYGNTPRWSSGTDKLNKLAKFISSATPATAWRPDFLDTALYHLRDAFFPVDPKVIKNQSALGKSMRAALDAQIEGLWAKTANGESVHRHLLKWLRGGLDTHAFHGGSSEFRISPWTARRHLMSLATYNWEDIRKRSIWGSDTPEILAVTFESLFVIAEELNTKACQRLKAAVASFSKYLHNINQAVAVCGVSNWRSKPPRTTVLDNNHFTELLDVLRKWGTTSAECGEPERSPRAQQCVLAAVLMFRTGLRGSEAVNLALNDIAFEGNVAELLVRGSAERPNKNRFSRRALPLHVLLLPDELADVRQWHSRRCDEEFHASPRAKLFLISLVEELSPDQYLLEPIDALIRLINGQTLFLITTRRQPGYWYALASPLRHSFASHLIASLLLPDEPINLPMPPGWTADLISTQRKQRLNAAFLPQGHLGLSLMQVVRYLMGHASYTKALDTYIHNIDWLLAAHLWRAANQPPMRLAEREAYLGLLPQVARDTKGGVSERQLRRNRANAAQQSVVPAAIARPARGRPPNSKALTVRQLSAVYDDYLGCSIARPAFLADYQTVSASLLPTRHPIEVPTRDWLALDNFLRWRRRGIGIERTAEQLALPLEACRRWDDRAGRLAQIQKSPRAKSEDSQFAGTGPDKPAARASNSRPRFDQLVHGLKPPLGRAGELIDAIWATWAAAAQPRQWRAVLHTLSRWPAEPSRRSSIERILQEVAFLEQIGVPASWLVLRAAGGNWQPYSPDLLAVLPIRGLQMTAAQPSTNGTGTKVLHETILYGLLLIVIDSKDDFGALVSNNIARKGPSLALKAM